MEYRILGPLEVVDGDRHLALGPPKQRAVLAALLVRAGEVVSLDQLIDELWGEVPPPAATGSLQAYVANLRKVLEPDRAPRNPSSTLRTRAPGYVLDVAPATLDAMVFRDLTGQGARLVADARPGEAIDAFDRGLALWRGEALADVAGYGFASAEAAVLAELRLTAREQRAEAALMLGRHTESIAELEALVADAPLRERVHELLALALYRGGRQGDALAALARVRRLLREELGVDPGPGIRALHAAVLAQDPALAHRPGPAAAPPLTTPSAAGADSAAPVLAVSRHALVGRTALVDEGRAALHRAAEGLGGCLLVAGEPGIGKSRLAHEWARLAEDLGFDVLEGRCEEGGEAPAFWPWTQVLRGLRSVRADQDVAVPARAAGPYLSVLAPDLAAGPALPPLQSAPPEQTRVRVYDAVTTLVHALAAQRPLCVVLEDLQWADAPTLGLAAYLGERLRDVPLVLVGTVRDTEPREGSNSDALEDALARLLRHPHVQRFRLGGLTLGEVTGMITQGTGAPADPELAAAVHRRTAGNPFFVSELTRLLRSESRGAGAQAVADLPVPDGLREVLRRRVRRLPAEARTLLTGAAVVGPQWDLDVVEHACGLEAEAALTAAEAAVMTGLLVEDREVVGRHRFVHALVRETLLADLSGTRRARTHAAVAAALHSLRGEAEIDALAHHAWQGGPAVPPDFAVTCLLGAADAAERLLAPERAIEQLQRAVTIAARSSEQAQRELDVQSRLGRLLRETRGYAGGAAEQAYRRIRELARSQPPGEGTADALWGLWAARLQQADYRGAEVLAAELAALAEEIASPQARLVAQYAFGIGAWFEGRYADADVLLARAVMLAEPLDLHRAWGPAVSAAVSACSTRAVVRVARGDAAEAVALRDRALAAAAVANRPVVTAYALFAAALLGVLQRDYSTVHRYAAAAIGAAREPGYRLWGLHAEVYDAWAAVLGGEPALARLQTAAAALDATGTRMLRTLVLGLRAEAELRTGDTTAAGASLAAAFAEAESTGEGFYLQALHRLDRQLGGEPSAREPSGARSATA